MWNRIYKHCPLFPTCYGVCPRDTDGLTMFVNNGDLFVIAVVTCVYVYDGWNQIKCCRLLRNNDVLIVSM